MSQVKKIELTIENKQGNGYETIQHPVKKIKFGQFTEVLNVANEIYKVIQQNESLQVIFEEIFTAEESPYDAEALANFTEEEKQQIAADNAKKAEQRFIRGLMGAFPLLLVHLPKHAIELLTILSDVERSVLDQQEYDTALDLYDAVLEVNDIEQIIERIKKSFSATKRTFSFLQKRRQATQPAMQPLQ